SGGALNTATIDVKGGLGGASGKAYLLAGGALSTGQISADAGLTVTGQNIAGPTGASVIWMNATNQGNYRPGGYTSTGGVSLQMDTGGDSNFLVPLLFRGSYTGTQIGSLNSWGSGDSIVMVARDDVN